MPSAVPDLIVVAAIVIVPIAIGFYFAKHQKRR